MNIIFSYNFIHTAAIGEYEMVHIHFALFRDTTTASVLSRIEHIWVNNGTEMNNKCTHAFTVESKVTLYRHSGTKMWYKRGRSSLLLFLMEPKFPNRDIRLQ